MRSTIKKIIKRDCGALHCCAIAGDDTNGIEIGFSRMFNDPNEEP